MSKMIAAPDTYIQGPGEIKKLATYFKNLGQKGAYIVVDSFIKENYTESIIESFIDSDIIFKLEEFGGECHMGEVNKHIKAVADADVVIGIGGGKTLDTAKAVAFNLDMPVMIVPTTASTDAPCSRLSVMYTPTGEVESYLFLKSSPNCVVMDTDIIINAPVRFLVSGMGDALATYYEAAACQQAGAKTLYGYEGSNTALTLAKLCLDILLNDGYQAKLAAERKVCTKAVDNVIEANTYLSGIGFESGGVAAAHSVHNGLANLQECHRFLHGEKVAFGVITQLVLQNSSSEEIESIIKFCQSVGLPTSFSDLNIADITDTTLMQVAEDACAPNETIHNMPFDVTPTDVYNAMKVADILGSK